MIFLQVCKALCPFYHGRPAIASKQDTAFLFFFFLKLQQTWKKVPGFEFTVGLILNASEPSKLWAEEANCENTEQWWLANTRASYGEVVGCGYRGGSQATPPGVYSMTATDYLGLGI